MWKLQHIHAKDFSAFKKLDYSPLEGHATLIFGNNMDNDSQKSNGSGKSALIEAIAVGLTGATLRNIKTEEIINDNADNATVEITLANAFLAQEIMITRELSRKNPQHIEIQLTDKLTAVSQDIVLSSVADYNKYILDALGLSKDDIYANYILSKYKYQPFLSSSDKDKKDIINRFSNGIMVDEAIEALQADMIPLGEDFQKAASEVDMATGRVSAMEEQIAAAIQSSVDNSKNKAARIQEWKEAIAQKRTFIREQKEAIQNNDILADKLEKAGKELENVENSDSSIEKAYAEICRIFNGNSLVPIKDYTQTLESLDARLKEMEQKYAQVEENVRKRMDAQTEAKAECNIINSGYALFKQNYDNDYPKVSEGIQALLQLINKLEDENRVNKRKRAEYGNQISLLEKQLAGVIVCPNCKHEFILADNIDIKKTRKELEDARNLNSENDLRMDAIQRQIDAGIEDGKKARSVQNDLDAQLSSWSSKVTRAKTELDRLIREVSDANSTLSLIKDKINYIQKQIACIRTDMFDEAFNTIDEKVTELDNESRRMETAVSNAEGAIQSYEESIADIEHASEDDMVGNLKKSKELYQKKLDEAMRMKEEIEGKLSSYKLQEATFTEFKTHLANSKIEALGNATNEFLEAIGSDIRIAFSGFTVLKSGKIRDKISVSLLRDGVNCGSFDKFSAGEQCRVNLANMLAMHKLTNASCPEGRGLDLLIIDEVLDSTDESGLANIFEAINKLGITSMIVSHGNIAENYPHKLVVNKQNGISFI